MRRHIAGLLRAVAERLDPTPAPVATATVTVTKPDEAWWMGGGSYTTSGSRGVYINWNGTSY